MHKAKQPKKYTPEEYLELRGETIYAVQGIFEFGNVYVTCDNRYIPIEEAPHLKSILGIEIFTVDDTEFRTTAATVFDDVYESEFREWVEKKKLQDPAEESNISAYCECEEREVYVGICTKCGKSLERIGG